MVTYKDELFYYFLNKIILSNFASERPVSQLNLISNEWLFFLIFFALISSYYILIFLNFLNHQY